MALSKSKLPAKRRKDLAVALATLIEAIDFPDFVAALLDGTFQAIVDGSVRQMEAYGQLVQDVALSVDAFRKDNVSADTARDRLIQKYGPLLGPDWPPKGERPSSRKKPARRLASSRQQLLATMVLMGINRIVVTDGKIHAKLSTTSPRRRSTSSG